MHRYVFALALFAATIAPAVPARAAAHPDCTAPVYRGFDFWAGNWDVFDTAGALQGHNRVTVEDQACVLHEHWASYPDDQTGQSLSGYDRRTKKWTHSFIDSYGDQILLAGTLIAPGVMRMTGHHPTAKGIDAIERTTWTRRGAAVRQVWDFSIDGGRTWKRHFEGVYRRHAG